MGSNAVLYLVRSILLGHSSPSICTWCGSRATECTLEMTFPSPISEGGSLGEGLARHVFSDPANAWSAATFSALTGITPLRIRRKLFAEGVAFTEVCRNQRLMRLLFSVLSDVGPSRALVRRTGWPEASDVEAHFYDKFGLTIDSACGLVQSRGGWQPTSCKLAASTPGRYRYVTEDLRGTRADDSGMEPGLDCPLGLWNVQLLSSLRFRRRL